ncbi:hypothetical protein [Acinetobacter sp. TGL-Y2]|uniref:hypothetical protein n=1 Tax=Acinetobacter sp. TGL-Y2 TaxID=1407071 RepID=UPI000AAB5BD8|nr:hypothetical protein [Acinetobacter sp. TGL-Y2]
MNETKDSKDTRRTHAIPMKSKIVGSIDASHIFDDQKYHYQCESGMNYITSIRIDS